MSLEEANEAFDRMVQASQAVFADPANIQKVEAAREAAKAYRVAMEAATRGVGFPKYLVDGWKPDGS